MVHCNTASSSRAVAVKAVSSTGSGATVVLTVYQALVVSVVLTVTVREAPDCAAPCFCQVAPLSRLRHTWAWLAAKFRLWSLSGSHERASVTGPAGGVDVFSRQMRSMP